MNLHRLPLGGLAAWLYVVGVGLIAAPWAFGYTDEVTPSLASLGLGIVTLLVVMVTRVPGGLVKLLPPDALELWGYLLAFGLVLLPFVPGPLWGDDDAASVVLIAVGVLTFVAILVTAFPAPEGRDPRLPPELPKRRRRAAPKAGGSTGVVTEGGAPTTEQEGDPVGTSDDDPDPRTRKDTTDGD